MEKITFVNNSEPYLSAENLNQLQTNIENAIKETYSTTKETYSTAEVKTNKIWVDGKSIYRKAIPITMQSSAEQKNYDIGISDLNSICNFYGIIYNSTNSTRPLPFIDANNITNNIRMDIQNGTTLRITTGASWSGYTGYVVIEYTKTTE